ncbi:hypothetical protein [Croceicoccus naphthovorans]|uniref:hypothetical protein n=1 Tax=Croceicoccus naphthovorans TaxID=1348774 RepID=UPI00069D73D4|nr:hypothetical protein [Croceicoccus naphthovorans]MBB3988955.1 hypothetical protein [Croceicoccus naphthovorans]
MTHAARLQSLLWTGAVVLATALSLVLMLQVKAVNSEIAETDKAIIAAKQQIAVLETEFQTRARQQQLVRWNEVDFGYVAPRADQFLDGRAELAALGKPVRIIEDAPVMMAEADSEATAAAPVRMAAAEKAETVTMGPVLKGKPEAVSDAPIRLAAAPAPTMMRRLVARDDAKLRAAKEETKVKPVAPANSAQSFADRFDIDSVVGKAN